MRVLGNRYRQSSVESLRTIARLLRAAGELLPPPAELEPYDGLKAGPGL